MSAEQPLPQPEVQQPHTTTGSVDPQSVEGLFLAALAKPDPDQRPAYLDEACADKEQRRRVEALLRAYADAGSFLEKPAAERDGAPGALDAPPPDEVPLDFLSPSDQPGCLGTLGPAPPPRPQPRRPTRRLPLLVARVAVYGALAAIGCVVEMGSVWAPTVSFLAVLFLAPLGWVAIWRGKRDGRRPWCDLSYTEAAVEAAKRGSEKTPITAPTESTVPGQSLAPMDEPMPGMPAGKPAADAPGAAGVPNLPPGVRWETKSDVETFSEGKVKLEACLLSEGMFVALRRRSSFNGAVASEEHLATPVGKTTLHVPPGECDVLVRDERFGWGGP